jgi:hypothetical protein
MRRGVGVGSTIGSTNWRLLEMSEQVWFAIGIIVGFLAGAATVMWWPDPYREAA